MIDGYGGFFDVITGEYTIDGNMAFDRFIELLEPQNHIFSNIGDFYDPDNPDHYILTAWNKDYQGKKIAASWFWDKTQAILVDTADMKIRAILEKILEIGFIPGDWIQFIDDRIEYSIFEGGAEFLSQKLWWIPVTFYLAEKKHNQGKRNINKIQLTEAQIAGRVHESLAA